MEKRLVFWIVALSVFVLDRISKFLVISYIPLNSSFDFSFFSLTHILNTGTAFGILKNASWFFILFAVAVSLYLIFKHNSFEKNLQFPLGLILAGACGNLVDRILYGAVVDFVDFHFWPAFNAADSAISIAVVWLLFYEFQKRKI